jgi:hypothetical protein
MIFVSIYADSTFLLDRFHEKTAKKPPVSCRRRLVFIERDSIYGQYQ